MTRRGASLLALLVAALCSACGPAEQPTGGDDVPLPPVAHLSPEIAAAVTSAHAAAVDEGTGAAWERYGRALFMVAENAAAEQALLRAAELDGADRPACLHAAGAAADGLDRARAARHFQAALAAGSPAASTRLRLAAVLEELGRLDEAEEQYRAVADSAPTSHVLLGLGRIALARGDTRAAIALLEQARAADDRHTEVLIALSQAYRRAGDEHRAEQFARAVGPRHQATPPLPDPYLREFVTRDAPR